MSATVRDNIVFSYEYDEVFYNLVLDGADAVCLRRGKTDVVVQHARFDRTLR